MEELGIIRLIIFDLDGTLIDSSRQIILAVNQARHELHLPSANREFLNSRIGLPARELFSDLELNELEIDHLVGVFRGHLRALTLGEGDVFNLVPQMLNLLKSRGYLLAVATNKPSDLAKIALNDTDLLQYFDLVVGSENLPAKPHPAVLEACLKDFCLIPAQGVMVGDRCEDMIAATCAKVVGFAVLQGVHTKAQLIDSGAKQVFLSIHELFEKLSEGWNFEHLQ